MHSCIYIYLSVYNLFFCCYETALVNIFKTEKLLENNKPSRADCYTSHADILLEVPIPNNRE